MSITKILLFHRVTAVVVLNFFLLLSIYFIFEITQEYYLHEFQQNNFYSLLEFYNHKFIFLSSTLAYFSFVASFALTFYGKNLGNLVETAKKHQTLFVLIFISMVVTFYILINNYDEKKYFLPAWFFYSAILPALFYYLINIVYDLFDVFNKSLLSNGTILIAYILPLVFVAEWIYITNSKYELYNYKNQFSKNFKKALSGTPNENKISKNDIFQLFIVGNDKATEIKEFVENKNVGGIYFTESFFSTDGGNTIGDYSIQKYLQRINKTSDKKYFIANDYELKERNLINNYYDQSLLANTMNQKFSYSLLAIGSTKNIDFAYEQGQEAGKILNNIGVNMLLGPVLDMKRSIYDTNLQNRSFGNHPDLITKMASAYILGVGSQGLISTLKHFPGHHAVDQIKEKFDNQHNYIRENYLCRTTLVNYIGKPFQEIIKNPFLPSYVIMTDHIRPTFGHEDELDFYIKILHKYGFNGLLLTDDMNMLLLSKYGQKNYGKKLTAQTLLDFEELKKSARKELAKDYATLIKTSFISGHNIILIRSISNMALSYIVDELYNSIKNNDVELEKAINTSLKKVNSFKKIYFNKRDIDSKRVYDYIEKHKEKKQENKIPVANINIVNEKILEKGIFHELKNSKLFIISSFSQRDDFVNTLINFGMINGKKDKLNSSKLLKKFCNDMDSQNFSSINICSQREEDFIINNVQNQLYREISNLIRTNESAFIEELKKYDYFLVSMTDSDDFIPIIHLYRAIKRYVNKIKDKESQYKEFKKLTEKIVLFSLGTPDKPYINLKGVEDLRIEEIIANINYITIFENNKFSMENYVKSISEDPGSPLNKEINIDKLTIDLPDYYYYDHNGLIGDFTLNKIVSYKKELYGMKKNPIHYYILENVDRLLFSAIVLLGIPSIMLLIRRIKRAKKENLG